MSIDYTTIRPAILGLLSVLSGVALTNVVWEDQGQQYGPVQIRCKILAPIPIGVDQIRYSDDEEGFTAAVCGNRQFTLSVTVETIDQTDGGFSLNYIETIRTRLRRESSLQTLRDAGMSIRDIQRVVEVPHNDGDHHWSSYTLDVRLNTVANDPDTQFDGAWIETVEINSSLDGSTLITTLRSFDEGFDSGFVRSTC